MGGQKTGALCLRKTSGSTADHIQQPERRGVLVPDRPEPAAFPGTQDKNLLVLPLGASGGKLCAYDLPGCLCSGKGQAEKVIGRASVVSVQPGSCT